MPAIRNQIRELRAAREMTQQDLADRVGVTRQTVIAMEQDKVLALARDRVQSRHRAGRVA